MVLHYLLSTLENEYLAGVLTAVFSYLCWLVWRFVFCAYLNPDEPQNLPYFIPYLGHVFSFLKNSEELLTTGSAYFKTNRAPFAITLAGSTVYVITDARDVSAVFNNTTTLSFNGFLLDIMTEFGTSYTGALKILEQRPERLGGGKFCKSISQKAHDFQVKQTQGKDLELLGSHIISLLQHRLAKGTIETATYLGPQRQNSVRGEHLLLRNWISTISIEAVQEAYFGEALSRIDPTLASSLNTVDEMSWQIFYKIPKVFRRQLSTHTEKILRALRLYLDLPSPSRRSQAWFTPALEKEYREAGLSNEDIATQLLFLYWGVNTNVSKIGYWMIAHLVFNPQLLGDVSKETAAAFNADGTLDPKHTYKSCPQLNAVWLEALRMSAASTVLRTITADTVIGGKVLRKGNQLLISARQLHFQSDVFGPRTNEFDHTRFLEKPELEGNAAFRPFGGGVTKCPGRNLAKYVALNLVVLVFHHFEVTADPDQQFPAYRERKPAIGIVSGEGDLRVRVRPRVKFSGNFLYSGMP